MEDDAQTKVIWRFIGRVLSEASDPDAIDGNDIFFKFADSQGQLRKPAFVEIVSRVFKGMIDKSGVLDKIIQYAWEFVASMRPSMTVGEALPVHLTKRQDFLEFRKNVLSKLDDLFPIIAQSLFRFFGNDCLM